MKVLSRRPVLYLALGLSALGAAIPVLSVRHEPAVDFPQHVFLAHVLRTAGDPGSFYSSIYQVRPGLTYVTFYYFTRLLAPLIGEEHGLQLWLALVVAAIPISMALLLRQLGRSEWLAILAVPLVFTDNFYWGLVAFLSSVPLTLFVLAYLLEVLQRTDNSKRPVIGLAVSLALLQLTHAAGMIFPAMAVPLLLLTTPATWARRKRALVGLAPGVLLFGLWVLHSMGEKRKVGDPNQPWTAAGPIWDTDNYTFIPLRDRLHQFVDLLANGFWRWADQPPLKALLVLAALALIASLFQWRTWTSHGIAGWRGLMLFALAIACFCWLPMDIKGYMYQIYPRYSQVAALLAIPLLALPARGPGPIFVAASLGVAIYFSVTLTDLFRQFDAEAASFEEVAAAIPEHSRIMHLVLAQGSGVSTHAVYLHYAALAALRQDGIPSFSLALDLSFPVNYLPDKRPPAPPSEWRPYPFDWNTQATWYDYFLVRVNAHPEQLFRGHLSDVELVRSSDKWALYKRIGGSASY